MKRYRQWIVFFCSLSFTSAGVVLENGIKFSDEAPLPERNTTNRNFKPISGYKSLVEICSKNNCTEYSTNESITTTDRVIDRLCNCDEKCVDYRDCCVDSKYYDKEAQKQPAMYECRAYGSEKFIVKSACPPSWKDRGVRENCTVSREHANLNTENVELGIPVTSLTTNFTYANAYCAICNSEQHFKLWKVEVKYDCGSQNYDFSTRTCKNIKNVTIEGLRFNGTRWYFIYNDTAKYCNLEASPSADTPYERCKISRIIDSCPATWIDSKTKEACSGPYLRVYDRKHHKVYKNKYCGFCNDVNETNLSCLILAMSGRDFALSFTGIFNFTFDNSINFCHRDQISISEQICSIEGNYAQIPTSSEEYWLFSVYTLVAVSVSLILLAAHLIIFLFVKELHTIGGKNIASYSIALTLAYGTFLLGNFVSGVICAIVAVLVYYFFLCAFMWMLTISYDLWRTFWNVTTHLQSPSNPRKTFLLYSSWSWGAPLLPVSITLCLNSYAFDSDFAPRFGQKGDACWFQNGYSLLIFFVAPVCIIIVMNFAFFLHTSVMVQRSRCQPVNRRPWLDFKLFARIALLTGITWILGFVGGYTQQMAIWFIFVFLNSSQGLLIFIAFSCKRRIFHSFLKRVGACANWQIMLQESITKSTKVKSTTNTVPHST